jgi:predicted GIY-YIG superfamily endonuclease
MPVDRGHFTQRYQLNRLVWFEYFSDVTAAIAREKWSEILLPLCGSE